MQTTYTIRIAWQDERTTEFTKSTWSEAKSAGDAAKLMDAAVTIYLNGEWVTTY
jgi:hypothetical protein